MGKIISTEEVKTLSAKLKQDEKKIVLAGGCFDILHVGHIAFLEAAKKQGGILILLLESDKAIKKLKGEKRPINNQQKRAKTLSAIQFVDFIITLPRPFETSDYNNLVRETAPDIIAVTSGDPNFLNKKFQAESVDGEVKEVIKKMPEYSTTKLIENL